MGREGLAEAAPGSVAGPLEAASFRGVPADHRDVGLSVYLGAVWRGASASRARWPAAFVPRTGAPAGTELMGAQMAELPRVRRGPLDALYAALRRLAPQIAATRPGDDGGGLRVAYRGQAATIVWDENLDVYAWASGEGGRLGPDAEKAAELIAGAMGAPGGSD